MDTVHWALRDLGLSTREYRHAFSIERSPACRTFIRANIKVPESQLHPDVTSINVKKLPYCDLYLAGFPCQPFSAAGKQQGQLDHRGNMFRYCRQYIAHHKPKAFVLENVAPLKEAPKFQSTFQAIMGSLRRLGCYDIHEQVLNTNENGLPQNRRRLYICGVLDTTKQSTMFEFPAPVPGLALTDILDMTDCRSQTSLPSTATGARNMAQGYADAFENYGINPLTRMIIVDIGTGPSRKTHWVLDHVPCITCSRGGAQNFWISTLSRKISINELLALQGFEPTSVKTAGLSDRQIGTMVIRMKSCFEPLVFS